MGLGLFGVVLRLIVWFLVDGCSLLDCCVGVWCFDLGWCTYLLGWLVFAVFVSLWVLLIVLVLYTCMHIALRDVRGSLVCCLVICVCLWMLLVGLLCLPVWL